MRGDMGTVLAANAMSPQAAEREAGLQSFAQSFAERIGSAAEIAGVGVIVVGAVLAVAIVFRNRARYASLDEGFEALRSLLGRAILLGLEFLVAADIIRTVATQPTLENLAVLAVIVLIRTFLSLSLGVEIEGRFPWQRRRAERGN